MTNNDNRTKKEGIRDSIIVAAGITIGLIIREIIDLNTRVESVVWRTVLSVVIVVAAIILLGFIVDKITEARKKKR